MDKRPDIIVGIDLGTTYTGVAWARPKANHALQSPIQVIHDWPGSGSKNEQKVHTCLMYNYESSTPSSWGFLCDDDDPANKVRWEFFKIFMDQPTLDEARGVGLTTVPNTVDEAQFLVSDFLRCLYSHLKATVENQAGYSNTPGGWQQATVEFIFSVPTTWRSLNIINKFKEAIKAGGFGVEGPGHTATVELTESEAAAVGTIKSSTVSFKRGDIFMTVDAGGGTTDFALMEVREAQEPFPQLAQISQVDGIGIGATLVDRAFVSMVNMRLSQFPELLHQLPPNCAEILMRSERFRTMKHKFGEPAYNFEHYKLPLEGCSYHFNHPGAAIESGKIVFTKAEIQALFDPHIDAIKLKIQEQLDWMQERGFAGHVNYMILSGGLGSSKYVRDRLQASLIGSHPKAPNVNILQAPDPQLVVVKGLLLDRLQRLESGSTNVLVSRIARSSYGCAHKTLYNPMIHHGTNYTLKKDNFDGQVYIMGLIEWLIKKGDSVNQNSPIMTKYRVKIDPAEENPTWDTVVLTSDLDRDRLPGMFSGGGVRQLCTVSSNLSGVQKHELEKKRGPRRSFFRKGKKYFTCTFEVRAIIAPADLRFELWFQGQKFSRNHQPIKVDWSAEPSELPPTPFTQ